MKEYKTNLMNIKWDLRKVIVIPVIVIINLFIKFFITDSMVIPVWLDGLGPLFGACVNGPLYGAIIAVLYNVTVMFIDPSNLLAKAVFTALMAAVAVLFGTIVRLGFFSNFKGVVFTIGITAFVEAALITPINFAFFGGTYAGNFLRVAVSARLESMYIGGAWANFLGFLLIALLDKLVVVLIIYGIMKIIPDSWAKACGFKKELPEFVIVSSAGDEAFVSKSDELKDKAQEKLNKKKDDEKVSNDTAENVPDISVEEKREEGK